MADISLRTQIFSEISQRFTEKMATLHDDQPVRELLKPVQRSFTRQGRKIRALEVTGKDRELLQAITDPKYGVSGISNRMAEKLGTTSWGKDLSKKQLSARVSRHLSLLREHGLIRKVLQQNRCELSTCGRQITTALNALFAYQRKSS